MAKYRMFTYGIQMCPTFDRCFPSFPFTIFRHPVCHQENLFVVGLFKQKIDNIASCNAWKQNEQIFQNKQMAIQNRFDEHNV